MEGKTVNIPFYGRLVSDMWRARAVASLEHGSVFYEGDTWVDGIIIRKRPRSEPPTEQEIADRIDLLKTQDATRKKDEAKRARQFADALTEVEKKSADWPALRLVLDRLKMLEDGD